MRINFVGDIALHNIDPDRFDLSEDLKKIIAHGDINLGNFECPITRCDDKIDNHPIHLKCEVEGLKILEGFQAFSLANNHLLDYGIEGLADTIENLKKNNMAYFGGGHNQDEAIRPLIITKDGIKIAFIGATRFSFSKKKSPGPAKDSLPRIKKSIQKQKKDNCFVVVYFHWGFEYVPYPAPRDRRIAHKCIDYGADLILGAHPHIVQGFEKYGNKYIFYSLGNFIFDANVFKGLSFLENDPRILKSFVLSLDLSANFECTFQLYPCKISSGGVELLTEMEKVDLLEELNGMSTVFEGSYFTYLKEYFRYAAEISSQNKKVLVNYTLKKKWDLLKMIKIYSRANYQDVLNKVVGSVWKRQSKQIVISQKKR
jgi:hypothetical protein